MEKRCWLMSIHWQQWQASPCSPSGKTDGEWRVRTRSRAPWIPTRFCTYIACSSRGVDIGACYVCFRLPHVLMNPGNCCLLATARLAVHENSNSSAIRASGIQGPDAHASKNGRGRLGSRQACLVRSVKPQTGASRSSGVEKGAHDGEGETCTHQFAQIFACFEIPRGGTF